MTLQINRYTAEWIYRQTNRFVCGVYALCWICLTSWTTDRFVYGGVVQHTCIKCETDDCRGAYLEYDDPDGDSDELGIVNPGDARLGLTFGHW